MARVLNWLGWLLIAAGSDLFCIFCISFWAPAAFPKPLKSALPGGVLIALAGHLLTQARAATDVAEKRSQFYLDSCVKAYEEVRSLLSDGNNNRATWIAAGRALMHAKELAGRVTVHAHLRVLELHKLKYRAFFHDALTSKPAAFFYGVRDTSLPLDDAAALSTASEDRHGRGSRLL